MPVKFVVKEEEEEVVKFYMKERSKGVGVFAIMPDGTHYLVLQISPDGVERWNLPSETAKVLTLGAGQKINLLT